MFAGGSIFSEETQQVELGEESPAAEKKDAEDDKSLFDMETEPMLASAKTPNPIFEEQTQVVCADNGRGESPKGNGDLSPDRGNEKAVKPVEVEPEIAVEKVKYLCGEDEDTLPDRFGDRKSQVRFGSPRPSFAIFFIVLAIMPYTSDE